MKICANLSVIRRSLPLFALALAVTASRRLGGEAAVPGPEPSSGAALARATAAEVGKSKRDIRALSQHFLDPRGKTSPWMFVPEENIASRSLEEHAGVLTIWEAGRGKDVKGILEDPIRIDDYPLPWEL